MPFSDEPDARVVSNLDNPAALRMPLESLAFRFGSAPRDEWTLFGQVGSVPLSGDTPFEFGGMLGSDIDKALQRVFNVLRKLRAVDSIRGVSGNLRCSDRPLSRLMVCANF